jgi:glycosyltransferase involved in cell wall biosynthesis
VIQGRRRGPDKAFYSPELKLLAASVVEQAGWFHGHGLYVWTNMWLGSEAQKRDRPLVYHPHGFFDPWILRRSRGKKRLAHWLFEDKNFAHVRWWRALSSKEADQIRAVVGPQAVVHVIPNGIDLEEVDSVQSSVSVGLTRQACLVAAATHLRKLRFEDSAGREQEQEVGDRRSEKVGKGRDERPRSSAPASPDDPADRPYQDTRPGAWTRRKRPKRLLFLSRIHPKKGLDLLVPAWGRLGKDFPDWELLIVGPDEGGYQAIIERMIADCGCQETCRIHPAVSGVEKHALLRTADLFVLPSYSEGFPMAVLEAAAHRVPVVQTTECNFPELTAAGGAWECRPEVTALEDSLRQALSADDIERAERGARGRQLVEANYTWDQLAARVEEICRSFSNVKR